MRIRIGTNVHGALVWLAIARKLLR